MIVETSMIHAHRSFIVKYFDGFCHHRTENPDVFRREREVRSAVETRRRRRRRRRQHRETEDRREHARPAEGRGHGRHQGLQPLRERSGQRPAGALQGCGGVREGGLHLFLQILELLVNQLLHYST